MTRRIEVSIDKKGQVQVEFIGFVGDTCFDEAERLQAVLAKMGLKVDVEQVIRKSAGQIEHELGVEESKDELVVRRPE